jgi:hypothetical protein
MKKSNISTTLFVLITLILLINSIFSIVSLVEDGAFLHRAIPAAAWSIGTIVWVVAFLIRKKVRP